MIKGAQNVAAQAARRVGSAHKPMVRFARRRARERDERALRASAAAVDRDIRRVASGRAPIVAGPWLAEVGYEVLYWIPFLRWFCDVHGVPRDRLIVLSRGGMEPLYRELASRYVDIFDLMTPAELVARNEARRAADEQGGRKQTQSSALDDELIARAVDAIGERRVSVCHPSLMNGLLRPVWLGNLPYDLLWRRTAYARMTVPGDGLPDLPPAFIAAKLYAGPALTMTPETVEAVRRLVRTVAATTPVIALETPEGLDEHRDFDLSGIPGVTSAASFIETRTNLRTQTALIARARMFLGSCGGLAWLAPFLGIPTVAVYDSDALLGPHLLVARQAGRRVDAAPFSPLDVHALSRLGASFQ